MEGQKKDNGMNEEKDEFKEGMNLIKNLIQKHPRRSILCIPVVFYIIYQIYFIFTYNFHNLLYGQSSLSVVISDFLPIIAGLMLGDVGLWLFYGPKNYKEVKEEVTGEYQKGYGVVSHTIAFIVAVAVFCMFR